MIITAFVALAVVMPVRAEAPVEETLSELVEMDFTCYCPESCPGTITASGKPVAVGILACNPRFGQTAVVYTTDMSECLGVFEAADKGGSKGLRNGTQIDCWVPDLKTARAWMKKTGGKVLVQWIDSAEG